MAKEMNFFLGYAALAAGVTAVCLWLVWAVMKPGTGSGYLLWTPPMRNGIVVSAASDAWFHVVGTACTDPADSPAVHWISLSGDAEVCLDGYAERDAGPLLYTIFKRTGPETESAYSCRTGTDSGTSLPAMGSVSP